MNIGFANDNAIGVQVSKVASKKGKESRRVFDVLQKHKSHNKISKRKNNSQSKLGWSHHAVKRDVNAAAKTIKSIVNINEKNRKVALQRVRRLHATSKRPTVAPTAAKTAEQK